MGEIEELAEIFKALSDPTRLKLVRLLSEQSEGECTGPCNGTGFLCVNALAHKLGVTQSAVSQHLRILRQAGLVRGERRGPSYTTHLTKTGYTSTGSHSKKH